MVEKGEGEIIKKCRKTWKIKGKIPKAKMEEKNEEKRQIKTWKINGKIPAIEKILKKQKKRTN